MKIAFLDRDGVINKEVNYLYKMDDFTFTDNCILGLKRLQDNGYSLVIITNQAGIARGYYTEDEYHKLTAWYLAKLKEYDVNILDVFFCPHHIDGKIDRYSHECDCRKPKIGMLELASNKYQFNVEECILVGDKESDLLAGINFGIKKLFLVETGHKIDKDLYSNYSVIPDLLCIPL